MTSLTAAVRWFISMFEDKAHPNHLSSSRVMGLTWGLTSCAVALMLVGSAVTGGHLLVAELIGGSLVALGLRNLGNGRNRED